MMLDLDRITHPLRLAAGSHEPGSGRGCAMNVISYVNGDSKITDFPKCSARPLARMVQVINDGLATSPSGLLSPEDSLVVLDLGWLTVGTSGGGASQSVVNQWLSDLLVDPTWGIVQFAAPDHESLVRQIALRARQGAGLTIDELDETGSIAWGIKSQLTFAPESYVAITAYEIATYVHVRGPSLVSAAASAAKANGPRSVEFTRWAIQRWRDLQGLDQGDDLTAADVDSALSQMGVS